MSSKPHPALTSTSHRPWPLPPGPWTMSQTWHDLLFAHWPIEPQTLRPLVPAELALDIREGRCWIGVVPFHMSHIHARSLPPLPWFSRFPEMNVRTYVSVDDKPGVYFFSLDAASRLAVWAARTFYRLPYFHAEMAVGIQNNWVTYESHRHASPAEFRGRYRPSGPAQIRSTGSLEHWLTERYCLYTSLENPSIAPRSTTIRGRCRKPRRRLK